MENHDSMTLEISRMLRKPLEIMNRKVNQIIDQNKESSDQDQNSLVSDLKYMIYSGHDDNVVNMLNFLGHEFYWIPYASSVVYELKYSAMCIEEKTTTNPGNLEECFGVAIRLNGSPLQLPGCTGDLFTLEGCKYPEFVQLIESKWYSGLYADDLNAACFQPILPPPTTSIE